MMPDRRIVPHKESVEYVASPRIRVAHLITSLNIGGAEQQMKHLVLASSRDRLEQLVISMTNIGPIGEELQKAGVKVYSLEMPRGKPTLVGLFRLRRLLCRLRPEVLHCWLYHSCLLGILAGRLAKIPKVVWSLQSANKNLATYHFQTRLVVRLCAILSRFPDAIIPNSETGKSLHERWGYSTSGMRVIPNGIDLNLFRPDHAARASVREELGISSDTILIGLFARYHAMKDHVTFFRAAHIVHERKLNAQFVLAGVGITANNPELSRMLEDSGLQGVVHLLGARADIPRLTASLDIACLSSWSESAPFVVCEAMACGVPCVVTDVGDVPRIVGEAGRVVPPHDPESLAGALIQLIDLGSVKRRDLGSLAQQRICAQFSLEQSLHSYETLYEDLRTSNGLETARSLAG